MASKYTEIATTLLNTTPISGKKLGSSKKPNAMYIGEYLKSQGYTKAGTQAVLANINKESRFEPSIVEIGVGGSSAIGGKGGIGLIQWTGQKTRSGKLRRRGLLEKAANYSIQVRDSLDFQTKYLVSEVKGQKISTILRTETDPVVACLELLFLDIRPATAINFKKAITEGKTPNSSDIRAVQARVNSLWYLQDIVDEIWGDEEDEEEEVEEEEVEEEDIDEVPSETVQQNGKNYPVTGQQFVPFTADMFKALTEREDGTEVNGAAHFKEHLSNFVAFELYNLEYKGTGWVDNDNANGFYLPLRVVLDVFNNYISIRDNTTDNEQGSNTPGRKLTQFYTGEQDPDPTKSDYFKIAKFITNEKHFSIDPLRCVLPNATQPTQLLTSTGKPVEFKKESNNKGPVTEYALGYISKDSFHKNVDDAFKNGLMRGKTDDILNILVSVEFLKQELDKFVQTDKDTDQVEFDDMVTFIKTIIRGFNDVLGSINDFDLHYDEQENLFYVVDRKRTPTHNTVNIANRKAKAINLTGLTTTISKLSVSSKISNRIGSMIAVAAQGTGEHTKKSIAPMLEWNRGLLDRHIISKSQTDAGKGDSKEVGEKEDKRLKSWAKLYYKFWQEFNGNDSSGFLEDGDVDTGAIRNLKQYHKTYCKKFVLDKIAKTTKSKIPPPGVIPVELSFTMMGISGMKIGQFFEVEPGVLPEQYTDNFGFLITGIDHTISDNKWTTEIKTQFYPKRDIESSELK